MATVEVTFTPLPAHVRTARLVATAVARRSGVDVSLLDEVRLAVGEACSRAVEAHQKHCPGQPIRVALTDDGERFEIVVTDAVPADVALTDAAGAHGASADPAGVPPAGGAAPHVLTVAVPADGNGSAGAAAAGAGDCWDTPDGVPEQGRPGDPARLGDAPAGRQRPKDGVAGVR